MNTQSNLEKLDEKVSQVLEEYRTTKDENDMMRNEIITLKANCELKNQEIEKLTEDNTMKDLEIEEIMIKIENILG